MSGTKYGVQSVESNCTAWVRGLGVGMKNGKWEVWSVERGAWSRDWGVRNANCKEKITFPNQIPHAPLQQFGTLTINATSHPSQPCQCGKAQGINTHNGVPATHNNIPRAQYTHEYICMHMTCTSAFPTCFTTTGLVLK